MKRLRVKFSNDAARSTLRYCVLTACLLSSPLKATTVVYPLSYSARLTDGNGSPLEGLIDVDVKFFATESSTTLLGQNFLFTGVALNQGVLTLSINMMDSQVAAIFGDGSETVYIELTAGGKTYPRQRYSFVPLALRVPIDQKTLSFDPNGKLGISLKTQPGTNQFLTKNGNGELTWGSPAVVTASSIQGKTVSSSAPQAGQILTYSGSEWIPQTPVNGSGSGTLSVGVGGTGATSFTNNGVLIGAGAGPISATAAGTQENVLKVGASGPEFGKVNVASSEAVTGKLTLANGGTGSDLAATGGSGQYVKQSTTGGPLSVGTIQPEDITTALGSMLATATASGTGPGWSASGNTHTLSIPMASNTGVAAGLLSNGDYATFASKLGSVSAGTGITVAPSGSSVTLGLDTIGTAGTYAKVTTDAYGRVVSGATLSTSDLPPLTAMVGADGNAAGKVGAVPAPAATDDAKFLRGDGTWSTTPATAGGSANEIQYNSGGMLTGNSSFVYAAGNVGIGTTSPGSALDITGQIKIQGGSPGVGKVLTSDGDGLATWSTAAVGSITGVTAGTGLIGGGTSGSVTLNADVGTTANKLVQLDASAKLPAVDGSALTNINPINFSSAVAVSKGGTGLTSGTSGGIPYFNAASTMASSAALTANGVVLGGGAGAAPTSTAAGAANSVLLVPSGGGAPSFGALDVSQSAAVTGTLNLGNGGTGASLLLTGGTGQYLKQTASGAAVTVGTIAAADLPTMLGDSGSGGTKGVVPAPASGDSAAGKFLKADGSWSVPAGTTNWAVPGTIGSITPNTGAFTTLTASGNVGIGTTAPGVQLELATGPLRIANYARTYLGVQNPGGSYARLASYDTSNPVHQAVFSVNGVSDNASTTLFQDNAAQPTWFMTLGAGGTNGFDGFRIKRAPAGSTSSTSLATLMAVDENGNVGIGLTSPGATLDVSGTARFMKNFLGSYPTFGSDLGTGGLLIGWNGQSDTHGETDFINFPGLGTGGFNFVFANSGGTVTSTPVVINPSGNVGIGTTSPGSILHLNGANPSITLQPTAGGPQSGIQFVTPTNTSGMSIGRDRNSTGTNDMFFYDQVAGATRMYISSTGNVGIGTTAPTTLLQVERTNDGPAIAYTRNPSAGSAAYAANFLGNDTGFPTVLFLNSSTRTADGGASTATLRNDAGALRLQAQGGAEAIYIAPASGNVGIGTTNPGVKLSVSGGQIAGSYLSSTNGSSGTPINWNSGNIQTTSIAAGTLYLDPASMVDGAGYTLILTNATGGSYTLSSTGYTFMCNPACPVTVTAAKHTIASMIKAGTVVYVSWVKDFQ